MSQHGAPLYTLAPSDASVVGRPGRADAVRRLSRPALSRADRAFFEIFAGAVGRSPEVPS